MAGTKFTTPIEVNAPGKDVVFDGFDFTAGAVVNVTAANTLTIRNSRIYGIQKATNWITLKGETKVTIEDNFFSTNETIEKIIEIAGKLLPGSTIRRNYFADKSFNKYAVVLNNIDDGTYTISGNTFETVDRPYSFAASGSPSVIVNIDENVLKTTTAGPDNNGPALVHVYPAKDATTYENVSFVANKLTGVKSPVTVFIGEHTAKLENNQIPTCTLNGEPTPIPIDRQNSAASIGIIQYATIEDACAHAVAGDTIELTKDSAFNNSKATDDDSALFVIPDEVVFDGNNHTIFAKPEQWTGTNKNHIFSLGNNSSISNIVIDGNNKTKSGILCTKGTSTITHVTVNKCGNYGIQVIGNATVTIDEFNSNNNAMGAINANKDSSDSTPTVTINTATMKEKVEAVTEVLDKTVITAPNLQEVIGVGTNLKGYKYYTSDKSRLGVAAVTVAGVTSVYEDKSAAEQAAGDAGVEVEDLAKQ